MNKEQYELVKENNPLFARLWLAATETFPDEKLREYFTDYKAFHEFYSKMNQYYSGEDTRFFDMFKICPELKSKASSTSDEVGILADAWSSKVKWDSY